MNEPWILTRLQVLELLSDQARGGSVTALVALERSLRLKDEVHGSSNELQAELDRLVEEDDS